MLSYSSHMGTNSLEPGPTPPSSVVEQPYHPFPSEQRKLFQLVKAAQGKTSYGKVVLRPWPMPVCHCPSWEMRPAPEMNSDGPDRSFPCLIFCLVTGITNMVMLKTHRGPRNTFSRGHCSICQSTKEKSH